MVGKSRTVKSNRKDTKGYQVKPREDEWLPVDAEMSRNALDKCGGPERKLAKRIPVSYIYPREVKLIYCGVWALINRSSQE